MTRERSRWFAFAALIAVAVAIGLLLRRPVRDATTLPKPEPSGEPAAVDPRLERRTSEDLPASEQSSANERASLHASGAELSVLVIDRATGAALAGVPVEIRSEEGTAIPPMASGTDGRCRFASLDPGEYSVTPSSDGDLDFAADPVHVTAKENESAEVVLRVERRWFLAGVVVEAGSGTPAPGIGLSTRDALGQVSRLATSEAGGRFRSRKSYPAGPWVVVLSDTLTEGIVRNHGPGPDLLRVNVGQEDVAHLTVELSWVGVLHGVVLGPRDEPIAGAEVRVLGGDSIYLANVNLRYWGLYENMRSIGRVAKSDAEGGFSFTRLPDDRTLVVVAKAAGCAPGRSPALAPPFRTDAEPVRLKLERGGSVAGRVLDAQGAALGRIAITAQSADAEYQPDPTRTDESGAYRFAGLRPGPTEITALAQESGALPHAVAGGKVDVVAGEEVRLDLRVGEDGVHLAGVAVDPAGDVLTRERATLELRTRPLDPRPGDVTWGADSHVAADGTFDVTVPREGRYELTLLGVVAGDPWVSQQVEAPARNLKLVYPLEPTTELTVHILDADGGAPIDRGNLIIAWGRGSLGGDFLHGLSRIAVRAGRYTLIADAKGYAPESRELDLGVPVEARTSVELRLGKGRPISGVVRDTSGRPARGIAIALQVRGQLQTSNLVYSGEEGRFAIATAPASGGAVCAIDADYRTLASAEIGTGDVVLVLGTK